MANLHDCLQRAVDAGELDQIRADQAKSEFEQLVDRYEQAMPRHQAEATAALHLKEATRKAQRSRRHAVLNQLQAMKRHHALISQAPDPAVALRSLIEFSEGSGFTGESVQSLSEALIRSINGGLNDVLRETGRTMTGRNRDAVLLRDLVRELHGEATGSARAGELAQAVRHQQKRLRQMFNAHGGDIGELADYGLPHSHDVVALRRAGFDAWAAEIAPKLDWSRMPDLKTGQPFAAAGALPNPARQREFLEGIYRSIVTRGQEGRQPSMAPGGKALYRSRDDHRVLHFRDGSAWLDYNQTFGSSDPFSAMIGGLHGMARDVAQMRVLGPNPKLGLEYATQVARKRATDASDWALEARIDQQAALARAMLAHADGSVNNTHNEAWARFFSNTRKVLTSIQLGSAMLSSTSDVVTISTASAVMGMNPGNVLARSVKLMASKASRESAARMGYVADTLADAGRVAARYTGEVMAGEVAERLSSFTMRASMLSYWTDMHRISFQMEFAGLLADNAARGFDAIDAPLRQLFTERGITAADWDLLRAPGTLFREPGGADFLTPFHWLEHQTTLPRAEAEGLAMRLQMAIEEQVEYAVPSTRLEGRARWMGDAKPGTFAGELLRSGLMYKSFAMSLTIGQWRRIAAQPGMANKAIYAASISAGMILAGAMAVQLKQVKKGNDPRPMDDRAFWGAALMQGGGVGIFGDFFAAETNRFGGGWAETLSGPVVSFGSAIARPVLSNATRVAQGKDSLIGRDAANFVRYNTPVASSLWQLGPAFDRLVADTLQDFLDPDAGTAWKRQMRKLERDYGTSTWWRRGETAPYRWPDTGNALGGRQ